MKMRTAASTALLLAFASLPVNPLLSPTAHAVGLTQTAPSAQRNNARPARAAQGLAPSPYFDRGTRVPLAPPVLRNRPRHETGRRDRQITTNRPQTGAIGLPRRESRVTGRATSPGITQTQRRTTPRTIDRNTPHANRDTAGISFWPRREISTIAPAPALRAPQFPYFGPPPGTRANTLARNAQRFTQRGAIWYFSAGHWYRPHHAGGFAVVVPPLGLAVPFLPIGSEEVYHGGQRYYVAGGVTLRRADDEYLIVNAPQIAPSDRGYYIDALDLIAEPISGQSKQKFGRDVDRCEGRAEARTGYDANRDDTSRAAERRYTLFSRAMSQCLEAAGYALY